MILQHGVIEEAQRLTACLIKFLRIFLQKKSVLSALYSRNWNWNALFHVDKIVGKKKIKLMNA